ncbi:MAG TPA: hypothetical protein VM266_12790 [Solirubrobacteraceae bacterium]|nr:hypothetical protein [Solirubrobacteraceae bacterium]
MRRLVLIAALLALAVPGSAAATTNLPIVGFGEQRAAVFSDPHWQKLNIRHMRLVAGWDFRRYRWQRREVDHWLAAAEAANVEPLVAFTRSRAHWRTRMLPTPRQYRRHFLAFRKRYPQVRTFLVWNEANHCSQPLCHKPQLAARYFDVVASACPDCKIVAADVLDKEGMVEWLQAFQRAARHTPRIWGLHNYLDANRMVTHGTRAMLRTVRGEIWFTETGGLVKRNSTSPYKFPESPSHAGRATRFVLHRLARLSPRIKRVYLYHFQNQGPTATWDSGVLDPKGRPRPAYRVVARWLARAERARRAGRG